MWNTDPVIVVLCAVSYGALVSVCGFIQALQLRQERRLSQGRRVALNEAMVEIEALSAQLREAQRNDHRDDKGRYASLEDVCIPPGNYPANR